MHLEQFSGGFLYISETMDLALVFLNSSVNEACYVSYVILFTLELGFKDKCFLFYFSQVK